MSAFARQTRAIEELDPAERQLRVDLAAAFRWTARLGWHEGVANHFSVAVSNDGRRFLMNPRWRHFARIRARDLLLLDTADPAALERPDAPDPTAWYIHAALHQELPQARCILHTHMPYATTLTTLKDGEIKPLDQNCLRFFGRVAYEDVYDGLALSIDEGRRFAHAIGDKSVLMLANSTGKELRLVSDNLAARVAKEWQDYEGFAEAHFQELKAILEAEEPEYAA
jgi:ribulose-5-phosphate 4-epimerase/fuculose-1-phosphate aldolase